LWIEDEADLEKYHYENTKGAESATANQTSRGSLPNPSVYHMTASSLMPAAFQLLRPFMTLVRDNACKFLDLFAFGKPFIQLKTLFPPRHRVSERRRPTPHSRNMAKAKSSGHVVNRLVYVRASYLYQAAACLASQPEASMSSLNESEASTEKQSVALKQTVPSANTNIARRMVTDLRSVALKAQIRLSPAIKQTVCKYCDTFLIEGTTCTSSVENKSKNGRKPWADVLVIKCNICQRAKRFPAELRRQKRRHLRALEPKKAATSLASGSEAALPPTAEDAGASADSTTKLPP
jgi:ribonuclease P protein subunit RPR2